MKYEYDVLVFIGRFQPPHLGHHKIIKEALNRAEKVLILVGSSNAARNMRNPFSFDERKVMIQQMFHKEGTERLYIRDIDDFTYNDNKWIEQIQNKVNIMSKLSGKKRELKIGLIGFNKDNTSYYLKLFPQWGAVSIEPYLNKDVLVSSTDIRTMLFDPYGLHGYKDLKNYLHPSTIEYLNCFLSTFTCEYRKTKLLEIIQDEMAMVNMYKESWKYAPYMPTFVTVDAVVIQSGHILLIERKQNTGKGLLALPGGFVEQDETLLDAAIRELREETKLKVPIPVLKGSLGDRDNPQLATHRVFDDINRSLRGRTITTVYYFKLNNMLELPKVQGGDDAASAKWYPLSSLNPKHMFEDHYHIITTMTGGAI